MGERMGPNTMGALHAGADYMAEQEYMAQAAEFVADAIIAEGEQEQAETGGSIFEPARLARDDDDAEALEKIRERRLAELKTSRASARYGSGVKVLQKTDWAREVVEASKAAWVVVHLHRADNPFCDPMFNALDALSGHHPTVKFVQIDAMHAMPPDKYHLLPSLFCYNNGALSQRLIGKEITAAGPPTSPGLEWMLAELGVLETELEEAPPASSAFQRSSPRSRQRDASPERERDAYSDDVSSATGFDYGEAEMD